MDRHHRSLGESVAHRSPYKDSLYKLLKNPSVLLVFSIILHLYHCTTAHTLAGDDRAAYPTPLYYSPVKKCSDCVASHALSEELPFL